jgi:hypothetical protein
VLYLHSSAKIINLNSELSGELYTLRDAGTIEDVLLAKRGALFSLEATEAWDREIFEAFGRFSQMFRTSGSSTYFVWPSATPLADVITSSKSRVGSGRRPTKSLRRDYRVQVEPIFEMRNLMEAVWAT